MTAGLNLAGLPDAGPELETLTGDGWHRWQQDDSVTIVRRLADGRYVAVIPLIYTWAIIVGDRWAGYDNRWCYHELAVAVAAATVWDGTGDPYGWHRNPIDGRRRPDGDPTQEYIAR